MKLSLAEIIKVTKAELKNSALSDNVYVSNVLTDTREDLTGALFIALKGENFDAHNFLINAQNAGAAAICINQSTAPELYQEIKVPLILVEDTLLAYQKIANFYRKSFKDLTVIAITGSVGKTSTKDILKTIGIKKFGEEAVLYTLGNTNNQIGVPQNLFRLNEKCRLAVIEMGTNHFGEILPLSLCAEPDHAIINSVAPCHLENLISLEGVAKEKSEVFAGVKAGGYAIFPCDIPHREILAEKAKKYSLKIKTYGKFSETNSFSAEYLSGDLMGSSFKLINHEQPNETIVNWNLSGEHQSFNASGAAVIGKLIGLSDSEIAEALAGVVLSGMRMKKTVFNGVTYLNDAYNANPASMRATLKNLRDIADKRRVVLLLGDMLELGTDEIIQHTQILQYAKENLPEATIIAVGPLMKKGGEALDFASEIIFVGNSLIATDKLKELDNNNLLIFLKGSRGMKLEQAIPMEAR